MSQVVAEALGKPPNSEELRSPAFRDLTLSMFEEAFVEGADSLWDMRPTDGERGRVRRPPTNWFVFGEETKHPNLRTIMCFAMTKCKHKVFVCRPTQNCHARHAQNRHLENRFLHSSYFYGGPPGPCVHCPL